MIYTKLVVRVDHRPRKYLFNFFEYGGGGSVFLVDIYLTHRKRDFVRDASAVFVVEFQARDSQFHSRRKADVTNMGIFVFYYKHLQHNKKQREKKNLTTVFTRETGKKTSRVPADCS